MALLVGIDGLKADPENEKLKQPLLKSSRKLCKILESMTER